MRSPVNVISLDAVRRQVHEALCAHDNLDPAQTPLFQAVIKRHGKPCGSFFHIQGPRLLRTYAVWTGNENRIICYDSKGERFSEIRLVLQTGQIKLAA